jgi:hypothetical protein
MNLDFKTDRQNLPTPLRRFSPEGEKALAPGKTHSEPKPGRTRVFAWTPGLPIAIFGDWHHGYGCWNAICFKLELLCVGSLEGIR